MAHRIGRREDIAEGLLRLLAHDVGRAESELTANSGRRDARIHRVRQRLKRARTILRLLEPAFGERAVSARRSLVEAGRLLAHARDADVAAASARDLAVSAGNHSDLGLDNIVETLDREAELAHRLKTPVGEVVMRLASAKAHIANFKPTFDGPLLVTAAIGSAYAKGRSAMRVAQNSLATPDLHDWRKAVKDLWHLHTLMRKRLPRHAEKRARRLSALSEMLGLDNDHAGLAEKLALSPSADHALMSQLSLISTRRRSLENEAFALGARIYAKKPKAARRKLKLK